MKQETLVQKIGNTVRNTITRFTEKAPPHTETRGEPIVTIEYFEYETLKGRPTKLRPANKRLSRRALDMLNKLFYRR